MSSPAPLRVAVVPVRVLRKLGLPAENMAVYLDEKTLDSIVSAIPESYLRFLENVHKTIQSPDFVASYENSLLFARTKFENGKFSQFFVSVCERDGRRYYQYASADAVQGAEFVRV